MNRKLLIPMLLLLMLPATYITFALTPTLKLNPLTSPITQQANIQFSGSITSVPIPVGGTVRIEYSIYPDGPFTTAPTNPYFIYIKSSGTYSGNFTGPTQTGTYYMRAYFPQYSSSADTWNAATSSLQTIIVVEGEVIPTPTPDYILLIVAWLEASLVFGIPNWALILIAAFILTSRR